MADTLLPASPPPQLSGLRVWRSLVLMGIESLPLFALFLYAKKNAVGVLSCSSFTFAIGLGRLAFYGADEPLFIVDKGF